MAFARRFGWLSVAVHFVESEEVGRSGWLSEPERAMRMMNGHSRGVDPIEIEVYRVIRERFGPLARYGGPLFAGIYVHQGIAGGFYVDQQKRWLWLPDSPDGQRPEDAFLSDEALARQADLRTVVENLLRNSRLIFELYLEHLERIQDLPTFVADLGVYLTDEIALVVDAIALRGRREN